MPKLPYLEVVAHDFFLNTSGNREWVNRTIPRRLASQDCRNVLQRKLEGPALLARRR